MKNPFHSRNRSTGFTLVELMVSIALGLLVVLALTTLLINVSRNDTEMSKTSSMVENGRFAMMLLKADIEHAGYWAGFVPEFDDLSIASAPTDVPTTLADLCQNYSAAAWTALDKKNIVGISVQGFDIPAVGTITTPNCDTSSTGAYNPIVSPQRGTDVLVVRHADTGTATGTPSDGNVYFQFDLCGPTRPSPPYVLATSGWTKTKRDCSTISEIRKLASNIYYVRSYSGSGDSVPTLVRSNFSVASSVVGHQPADALVEGIEGFRVEFGIDNVSKSGSSVSLAQAINWGNTTNLTNPTNRGDGIADGSYVRCTIAAPCTVAQLTNVVAVKIYVLARNLTTSPGYVDTKTYTLGTTTMGPFNDNYKRHLFSQTIRLENPSSRRETQ